ncbi:hypothetical protein LAZ67_6000122 [Cordylochernes scorpioides]|uniref:Uncharacterized protein n=1 Tax=Cordylochernes scorpioides TaxID=51811 RepID=A0ABY6KJA2_9ARAC|nr:hypothetical protein LAZ67_6000122 [Cordylochernes scorpioides]
MLTHASDPHLRVQGNLGAISNRTPVFLTMHDVGSNHAEFHVLTEHPTMEKINARSVFLHVEAPGHEMDAADLPGRWVCSHVHEVLHSPDVHRHSVLFVCKLDGNSGTASRS